MNVNAQTSNGANGESAGHDLFALSDEQILEIEPEAAPDTFTAVNSGEATTLPVNTTGQVEAKRDSPREERSEGRQSSVATLPRNDGVGAASQARASSEPPPKWLAEMIADPQAGGEARDFWNGIQHARQEAAAYREVFAKPEEARAAAERSRQLEQIDQLYFGVRGGKPEEAATARENLAETLLREDSAAFREMVFAGLRALEKANGAPGLSPASPARSQARENAPQERSATQAQGSDSAVVAQYTAFEKAANEELEREVGGAIERTLEQALPNITRDASQKPGAAKGDGASARDRLAGAMRQEIDAALRGDRQLGEQVAQLLAGRNFNDSTRAQVVRLIGARARQLVPVAAKRVLSDWTQTALSAHRAKTQRAESASARADLAPAESGGESSRARAEQGTRASARNDSHRRGASRVDYRKFSDEQILEMS
jgi:hypothetical protein